jgi:hypothetical protein
MIEYFKFDEGPNTMRFETTADSFICDIYRPVDGFWTHSPELSRYVLFEPGEIEAISAEEADRRTDGKRDEPVKAFREGPAPGKSEDPPMGAFR